MRIRIVLAVAMIVAGGVLPAPLRAFQAEKSAQKGSGKGRISPQNARFDPQNRPKSALDKATMEAYIRHLAVWGPKVKVEVLDPKPSPELPGFFEVVVRASVGPAAQEELFYVSADGKKMVRGTVFDINSNPFRADLAKLKTEAQPSFGADGAPVVVVAFSDYQCPYCKDEALMLRQKITAEFPKDVKVYFADFPLGQHNWARMAAIAGRCAFAQNREAFWSFHDWIFEHQEQVTPENLKQKVMEFAQGRNLDTIAFGRCLDARATEAEVDRTMAMAASLKVNSTPTMFINGRKLSSRVPWESLRQLILFEIEYQKTAKNAGESCCEVVLPAVPGN
jgi:protein-disulfide isomerase